ncbi:MAG: MBL fold metallo-hydrolase [Candidatus Micrarchaeota archaeon]
MELTFLGAAQEVGRSCIGVESDGLRLFMDAGVATNRDSPQLPLQNLKVPHAVALTHAHLDHSGYVPAIFKHSKPPVLTAFPTIPLVNMLLDDMQKILEEKGLPEYFSGADAKQMNRSFLGLPYEKEYEFFNGSSLKLFDAGHIIGSAQIYFKSKEGSLLYSGDINGVQTQLHRPATIPREEIDYLIMESTYGDREHPDRKKLTRDFCKKVKQGIEERASVIIPCFAVGRTQEIMLVLLENGLIDKTIIDGMGLRASETYLEYPSYLRNSEKFEEAFSEVGKCRGGAERKKFIKNGNVILCTAGMLDGGPALSYVQKFDAKGIATKMFLTGYQAAGSNGRMLLEKGQLKINGKIVNYKGDIEKFDFSAHSGKKELIEYAKDMSPKKIFLVHGDKDQMVALKNSLIEEGLDAKMPITGEKVIL